MISEKEEKRVVPPLIWTLIIISYLLPSLMEVIFGVHSVEMKWIIYFIPSIFFSYFFGV